MNDTRARRVSALSRLQVGLFTALFCLCVGLMSPAKADDIDIYINQNLLPAQAPLTVVVLDLNLLALNALECNNVLTSDQPDCKALRQLLTFKQLFNLLGAPMPILTGLDPLGLLGDLPNTTLSILDNVPPLVSTVLNNVVGSLIGTVTATVGSVLSPINPLDLSNNPALAMFMALESVLRPLVNTRVAVMLFHGDRGAEIGSRCSFADQSGVLNSNGQAALRQETVGCSNGAYMFLGLINLVSPVDLLSQLVPQVLNVVGGLVSGGGISPAALANLTSGSPYQTKESYAELIHYLRGDRVYNGHLDAYDSTLNKTLTWDRSVETSDHLSYRGALRDYPQACTINMLHVQASAATGQDDSDDDLKLLLPNADVNRDGRWGLAEVVDSAATDGFPFGTQGDRRKINSYFLVQDSVGSLSDLSSLRNLGYNVTSYTNLLGLMGRGQNLSGLVVSSTLSVDASLLSPSISSSRTSPTGIGDAAYVAEFRPDRDHKPAWAGNLKKLRLKPDSNGKYNYYDVGNQLAFANDGRIHNGALTYWTDPNKLGGRSTDGRNTTLGGAGQKITGFQVDGGGQPGRTNPATPGATTSRHLFYDSYPAGSSTLAVLNPDDAAVRTELASATGATAVTATATSSCQSSCNNTGSSCSSACSADQSTCNNECGITQSSCSTGCSATQSTCSSTAIGNRNTCSAAANTALTSCQLSNNPTTCQAAADTAQAVCKAGYDTTLATCTTSADGAQALCNTNASTTQAACLLPYSTTQAACQTTVAATQATCNAAASTTQTACNLPYSTALTTCQVTANTTKTTCDAAAATAQGVCLTPANATLTTCQTLAGTARTTCNIGCLGNSSCLAACTTTYNNSMNSCTTNFNNSSASCNATYNASLASCTTNYNNSNTSCTNTYNTGIAGCTTSYNNSVTSCTNNYNSGLASCNSAYNTGAAGCNSTYNNSITACTNTHTASIASCNTSYNNGIATCTTNHNNSTAACTANYNACTTTYNNSITSCNNTYDSAIAQCNTAYNSCSSGCTSNHSTCTTSCSNTASTCNADCSNVQNNCLTGCGTNSNRSVDTVTRELLLYARGYDVGTQAAPKGTGPSTSPTNTGISGRAWLMGAVLHSRPLAINYGQRNSDGTLQDNIRIVFGSADGYLRMVRDDDGSESWGFMPQAVMGNLKVLRENETGAAMPYGVDGSPVSLIRDRAPATGSNAGKLGVIGDSTEDRVLLFFGLRRGGSYYYSLDVTDPDAPKLRWRIGPDGLFQAGSNAAVAGSAAQFADLGLSFSTPQVGRMRIDADGNSATTNDISTKSVLIFGGGYNGGRNTAGTRIGKDLNNSRNATAADKIGRDDGNATTGRGNGLFIVDAETGALIWRGARANTKGYTSASLSYGNPLLVDSIASEVTALDTDNDGLTDRLYVGDTGGRLWRADFPGAYRSAWTLTPLASVGRHAESSPTVANDRRMFHAPDYVPIRNRDTAYDLVVFGTGDREDPLNVDTRDWVYVYRDTDVVSGKTSDEVIGAESGLNAARHSSFEDRTTACAARTGGSCSDISGLDPGYRIALGTNGEKLFSAPLSLGGASSFTTYIPPAPEDATCVPLEGSGRLYNISLRSSRPLPYVNQVGADRSSALASPGLPGELTAITNSTQAASSALIQQQTRTKWRASWRERLGEDEKELP